MSTYKPLIVNAGQVYQLDDPDGLAVAHITSTDYIQFDTAYSDGFVEGRLQWNSDDGTLEVGMPGGHVNLQIGQETLVKVRNVTGSTINNGTLVTINGSQANRPKIEPFDDSKHDSVCGYTTETINNNSYGYVTLRGIVRDLDTSTFNEGDHLWADVNNPGQVTNITPVPPQHKWWVGVVLVADANNGMIFADFESWHHLEEASDVSINSASLTGGEAIIWDVDNQYWKATGSPDTFPQYSHLKTGWRHNAYKYLTFTVNESTRTLSLSSPTNDEEYWIEGVRYVLDSTVNFTWTDTEGMWFLSLDANGPVVTQVQWDFPSDAVYVASVYWDATNKHVILWAPETHCWDITYGQHEWMHQYFGCMWVRGLNAAIVTGNTTINVSGGELHDQLLEAHVTDDAGSGSIHDMTLTPLTTVKLYRSGASGYWRKTASNSSPAYVSANIPQVNTWNGTSWVLTDVDVNRYFCYWMIGSTSGVTPVYYIIGQSDSGSLADIEAINWEDLTFGALPTEEHKILCKVIMQRTVGSPYYTVVEIQDLRRVGDYSAGSTGGSGVSDHGSLTGLTDDDHPQYVLADGSRTMTGNLTVNASINATGNITANRLTINTVNSGDGTGNVSFVSSNIIGVSTYYGTSANLSSTVNADYFAAGVLVQTPSLTSASGTINCADDHLVTTGNITGNVANLTTANLTGYLEGYAGSPSNNDVLTWVTSNGRAEFKPPASSSGNYVPLDGSSNMTGNLVTPGVGAATGNLNITSTINLGGYHIYSGDVYFEISESDSFVIDTGNNGIVSNGGSSAIVSGRNNTVNAFSSGIFTGNTNNIGNASVNSIIAGGYSNNVNNDDSLIAGGRTNSVSGPAAAIIGGVSNTINTTGNYSAVVGGESNDVRGASSIILAGKNNLITAKYAVAYGYYAKNDTHGAMAHTGGKISTHGDVQCLRFNVFGQTSGNTTGNLSLDGAGTNVSQPDNTVWYHRIVVAVQSTNGTYGGGTRIYGCTRRVGATHIFIATGNIAPNPFINQDFNNVYPMAFTIAANGEMYLSGKGPSGSNHNWNALWEVTQTGVF